MAITTMDTLVAALPSSICLPFYRASIATQATNGMSSWWRGVATGASPGIPLQGAIPAGAATCTDALDGTWTYTNPGGGSYMYLAGLSVCGASPGQLWLFDRLAHMGGLSGATTGPQTINLSLPSGRGATAGSSDLVWFCEIYTDIGTSAQSGTLTYVDTADQTRTVAFTIGGASPANQDSRIFPLVPNSGQPFKSLTSYNISTTTGAAGSFGFTVGRILASIDMGYSGVGRTMDCFGVNLPRVYDDSCLWFVQQCNTTATGIVAGVVTLIQG